MPAGSVCPAPAAISGSEVFKISQPEMLKDFTFDILIFVFRNRKCVRVLRNRLFGYSTAYNNSEGAILSWIAGTDTGARTPGGWGTAVSGHGNLKRFLLLYSKSCFPESEMLKGFTFDILVFIFRNRKT